MDVSCFPGLDKVFQGIVMNRTCCSRKSVSKNDVNSPIKKKLNHHVYEPGPNILVNVTEDREHADHEITI